MQSSTASYTPSRRASFLGMLDSVPSELFVRNLAINDALHLTVAIQDLLDDPWVSSPATEPIPCVFLDPSDDGSRLSSRRDPSLVADRCFTK